MAAPFGDRCWKQKSLKEFLFLEGEFLFLEGECIENIFTRLGNAYGKVSLDGIIVRRSISWVNSNPSEEGILGREIQMQKHVYVWLSTRETVQDTNYHLETQASKKKKWNI